MVGRIDVHFHMIPQFYADMVYAAGSGPAIDGVGGGEGFGTLQQNYLEEGNVQAVTELSSLIAAQRAYEMNSKVIQTVDSMFGTVSNNMR